MLACSGPALLAMVQPPPTITIRAGRLLDGRGASAGSLVVTIAGDKITSVGSGE